MCCIRSSGVENCAMAVVTSKAYALFPTPLERTQRTVYYNFKMICSFGAFYPKPLFYFITFVFMKKSVLLFACMSLLLRVYAQEQRFFVGAKAGVSTSQVSGDELAGYDKAGLVGGLQCAMKFSKKWTLQFEMIFVQKGSKYRARPDLGDPNYYRLQLNYMEVPVLFQYHYKKFTFEAGPAYGYLINYKEENAGGDVTGLRPFHNSEISINAGVNYTLPKNVGVNFRFSNSLNSIRDHESGAKVYYNPGQQNTALHFTVSYTFTHAKNE